jgi:Mrp family chromosome partitioning ATPase
MTVCTNAAAPHGREVPAATEVPDPELDPDPDLELATEHEMFTLHQGIDALLPGRASKVIHFTSSRPGEGTSTIVRALGKVLAMGLGRSVLILDANAARPGQHTHFGVDGGIGWNDLARKGEPVDAAVHRTSCQNLAISPISTAASSASAFFDAFLARRILAEFRTRFDVVLVDGSPALCAGALTFAGSADGVVLVVEAEKTRAPSVLRAKASIERNGGHVIGTVLNRRRFHIPGAIYRRL